MNCFECVTFNSGNPCKSWAGGDICEKFEEAEARTKEQVKKAENRRGKCKNCKYFTPADFVVMNHNKCRNSSFIYEVLDWKPLMDKAHSDSLYYFDDDERAAGFYPGENFGCIHWEEKK